MIDFFNDYDQQNKQEVNAAVDNVQVSKNDMDKEVLDTIAALRDTVTELKAQIQAINQTKTNESEDK